MGDVRSIFSPAETSCSAVQGVLKAQRDGCSMENMKLCGLCHLHLGQTFLVVNGSQDTWTLVCLWCDLSVMQLIESQMSSSLGYFLMTNADASPSDEAQLCSACHTDGKEEQPGWQHRIANRKEIIPCFSETSPRGVISFTSTCIPTCVLVECTAEWWQGLCLWLGCLY